MWAVPRHGLYTGDVLDVRDLNDNFSPFVWAASQFGEANWASNTCRDAMNNGLAEYDLAIDMGFIDKGKIDPHGSGGTDIPQSMNWELISGSRRTFESRGGPTLMVYSFQISNAPASATPSSEQTGLMFCIAVDGAPQPQSLLGSGDLANDVRSKPSFRNGSAVANTTFGTGPAVKSEQYGLRVSMIADLSPGRHVMELRARNLDTTDNSSDQECTQLIGYHMGFWA